MAAPTTTTLPPGTVHLLRVNGQDDATVQDEIILVPRPSRHPDDPLNWTPGRKALTMSMVFLYVFSTGIGGTSTYSLLTPIADDTGMTIAQLDQGTGYLFLLAGWTNLVWQPLALTIGRRPITLLSLAACAAISEWTAWIGDYPSWAAARCLYGLACAPVEVLPEIIIPDVFFAHQRGTYVGVYMLILCGSNFIAPLIAGFMNDAVGWHWVQHWAAILLAANLVLAFFFQEETWFPRSSVEVDEFVQEEEAGRSAAAAAAAAAAAEKGPREAKTKVPATDGDSPSSLPAGKKPYWKRLSLYAYSGVSARQMLTMAYRPILIFFLFPNVLWSGFMYGSALAWYNVYNATASSILSAAPYDFSAATVGLTYVAPLIGAIVAGLLTGKFSDWYTLRLAHRNAGIREPEQRLWGILIYCVLMPVGLILWGIGAAHKLPWPALLFGAILCGYCNVAGGTYALAYTVDCFKEIAGESIVSVILCRNTMAFAFNYAITPWIDSQGLQNTFIAVAILSCAFALTFLLMIWKGKYFRTVCADRYWRYAATQVVHHE